MLQNILRQARVGIAILLHVTTTPVHKKVCILLAMLLSSHSLLQTSVYSLTSVCVLGVDSESDR